MTTDENKVSNLRVDDITVRVRVRVRVSVRVRVRVRGEEPANR